MLSDQLSYACWNGSIFSGDFMECRGSSILQNELAPHRGWGVEKVSNLKTHYYFSVYLSTFPVRFSIIRRYEIQMASRSTGSARTSTGATRRPTRSRCHGWTDVTERSSSELGCKNHARSPSTHSAVYCFIRIGEMMPTSVAWVWTGRRGSMSLTKNCWAGQTR